MQLVLASSSPYRRELFTRLGIPFIWASPNIDETPLPTETAKGLTRRLALAKARTLSDLHPHSLIIGSDQVCELDGVIMGKPGNFERARLQLLACSGKWVTFHTALVLYNSDTQSWQDSVDQYCVQFRTLADAEISDYLLRETPYDCAGSFKAEGLGIALFQAMAGADFHSLIGLPLISLCNLLREAGLNPLLATTAR